MAIQINVSATYQHLWVAHKLTESVGK